MRTTLGSGLAAGALLLAAAAPASAARTAYLSGISARVSQTTTWRIPAPSQPTCQQYGAGSQQVTLTTLRGLKLIVGESHGHIEAGRRPVLSGALVRTANVRVAEPAPGDCDPPQPLDCGTRALRNRVFSFTGSGRLGLEQDEDLTWSRLFETCPLVGDRQDDQGAGSLQAGRLVDFTAGPTQRALFTGRGRRAFHATFSRTFHFHSRDDGATADTTVRWDLAFRRTKLCNFRFGIVNACSPPARTV